MAEERAPAVQGRGRDVKDPTASEHRPLLRLLRREPGQGQEGHRPGDRTHDLWNSQDVSSVYLNCDFTLK